MSAHTAARGRNQIAVSEGRAAVASGNALLLTATTERGPPEQLKTYAGTRPLYVFSIAIGNGSNLMEGRAAVASVGTGYAATTERGPPKWHAVLGHDGAWPSRSPENMRAKRAEVPPYGSKMAYEAIGRWCRAVRLFAPSAPAL